MERMNTRPESDATECLGLIGKGIMLSAAISALLWLTGCAGVELGGRLGVYRVDERNDASATVQAQTKPWKCYFVDCGTEAHGS